MSLYKSLVVLLVAGCGRGLPEELVTEPVSGCLTLPEGVRVAQVSNGLGSVAVKDGCYTLPVDPEATMLAVAITPQGDPVSMGWVTPDTPDLTPRTTAETLLWFGVGGFTVGMEGGARVRERLSATDDADALADAIDKALAADPLAFRAEVPAVTAAMTKTVASLLEVPEPEGPLNATLVNPSGAQSGISINTASGFNRITLVNTLRRAAHAFVERVSYIDAEGVEVADPADITDLPIESVVGVTGGLAGISSILAATQEPGGLSGSENVGYVPRGFGPVDLPNKEGARRTRYHVVVVGPGAGTGVVDELTGAQETQRLLTSVEFLVRDFVAPMLLQVALPAVPADTLGGELGKAVVTDMGRLMSDQIPGLLDMAANGDPRGAIREIFTVLGQNGTLRQAVFSSILENLYDFRTEGLARSTANAAALAQGFANVTKALDMFFAVGDGTILLNSVLSSNRADRFVIDVTDAIVRMIPPEASIPTDGSQRFEVNVIDAGDDAVFEYRFSTTGRYGTLSNDLHEGDELTTSQPWVEYLPDGDEGIDEVSVEVLEIVLSERIAAGEGSATIEVTDDCDEDQWQEVTLDEVQHIGPCQPEGNVCAIHYFTYRFRGFEDVYSYVVDIDTNGDDGLGWRDGEKTLTRYSAAGTPSDNYHDADTVFGRYLERRSLTGLERVYIPKWVSNINYDSPSGPESFATGIESFAPRYRGSTVRIRPECPDPG